MRILWALLVILATSLAGCSGDDGNDIDIVTECDGIFADGVCTPHVEPRVTVAGLPSSFGAYSTVAFTWTLDNGTRGTDAVPVHSMDSRILVATDAGTVSNMTGPDEWGMEVARQQHQNLPGTFEASLSWDEEATLYLKGYMLIEGVNVWTDLGTVEVTPAQPTGNTTTVTVAGAPPQLDESSPSLVVGDAFVIANEEPVDYTAVFECSNGVSVGPLAVPTNGMSDPVLFQQPTNCTFTLQPSLVAGTVTQLDVSGTLNVYRP